jgi:radical SAM protein with 4Fe4S-binding SPASM domain
VGRKACPQIWQRIIVTWDGKVVMCCRDWESENVLGTLDYSAGKDLEYFWRGEKINNIRRLHLENKLDNITACSKCSYKESFQWKKDNRNK